MKNVLLISIFLLFLSIVTAMGRQRLQSVSEPEQTHAEEVHYHAGFVVFVDNQQQDYSSFRYMNLTQCGDHGHKLTPEEEQEEKAHLHDSVGDVVHVHRAVATWQDLFTNIEVSFAEDKPLVGYINGEPVENLLAQEIRDLDSVVIISGQVESLDQALAQAVPLERIQEVGQASELCGAQ